MTGDHLNILLIGGGGREHAIADRLRRSPSAGRLICAPGNPGIASLPGVTCLPIAPTQHDRLIEVIRRESIDLVVIGPEAPLQAGLADAITAASPRTRVFGPSARAAEIEASKIFAKGFMSRHGIPTAAYAVVQTEAQAAAFLDEGRRAGRLPWVIKADGLCAGKGVTLCADPDEALVAARAALSQGGGAVIEERLLGREASVMALCDGDHVRIFPACEDHKAIGDGDIGPMTGGMGAICPTPVLSPAALAQIHSTVLLPAARGLIAEGRPFHGLLYAGIMCTAAGPLVLEFNARFGDPETQPLSLLLTSPGADLLEWLDAVAGHRLAELRPADLLVPVADGAAVCVVLAAAGYPGTPRTGDPITGIAAAEAVAPGQIAVFHAGTSQAAPGAPLCTAGGRVLSVTARAPTPPEARDLAYSAADLIHFDGKQLRRDIGARGLP